MPTDVKLNAEGVEAARAVLVEGRDNFATFEQHAAGIVRAYLAALNNSKPTPAVGDDGLIERLRDIADDLAPVANVYWEEIVAIGEAASALAAAHSQHEADAEKIAKLIEALQRIFNVLTFPVDSSISPRR